MTVVLLVIGIACALYGVCVMMVGSGTWFFAFWYVLAALFIGAGWAVHSGAWEAIPVVGRRAIAGTLAVVLIAFAATQALIFTEFNDRGEPDLDCIVVLGAQVYEWGPSTVLKHRLDTAYDYLVENERTVCIVSGGKGANEHVAEANVMADYLIARGIPADRLRIEAASLNTAQNIAFSSQYFDPANDSVGIVTNNFHEFRALAIARKAGLAHPTGIAAPCDVNFLPNNLVRESLGIAKDFLIGNL